MKNKHTETAWSNATRSYNLPPVFVAIAEALETVPEEIKTNLDFESVYTVAQHCALLENMQWDMDFLRGDWVSLHVQGKRPFGNSGIAGDIIQHAGIEAEYDDMDGYSDEVEERAWDLFDELIFAAPEAAKVAGRALKGGGK